MTLQNFALSGNPLILKINTTTTATIECDGITLTAEPYEGVATFDVAPIVRTLFRDHQGGKGEFDYDKNLFAKVDVVSNGNSTTYTIARGVSARDSDDDLAHGVLSTLSTWRLYDGFPFYYSFVSPLLGSLVAISTDEFSPVQNDENIVLLGYISYNAFSDGETAILKNSRRGTVIDTRTILNLPAPAHPFYIRWINELGGYDYWMFACNQKRKLTLTANDYYQVEGQPGVTKSYNKTAKEVVEASTGIVDRQTLEALARMPLSPDIRLYNKDTQEWVPIQIESGDTEIMEAQPTGELVFSFVVP